MLITGGLGFIGSSLARRLVGIGADVLVVDNLVAEHGGNRFNLAGIEDHVTVEVCDVREERRFTSLVRNRDYLFNLAGQSSHLDSMHDPFTDLDINCRAQLSILETCRKVNPGIKVVFASTRQIYGRPERLPVDENHLLRPVDVNGINKMAGEWYHVLYNNVYGVRASALRLTNTIGPRMRIKDARQTFLGLWVRLLLEGRPIEVWGGAQRRDFNDVEDAVDALLLAAVNDAANGQVFNLGSHEVTSLAALAALLIAVNGAGSHVIREFPAEQQRIDIGDYCADFGRIGSTLGWAPRIGLRDTLERTLAYYRQHREHYL